MGKRKEYNFSGMKIVILGLILMAFDIFAIEILRALKIKPSLEFIGIFVMLLGWGLVFLGIQNISKYVKEYKLVKVAAAVMIVFVIVEGIFALVNFKNGMAEQAFIEFKVMFLAYTVNVGMLYAYQRLLKGTGILVKNYRSTNLTKRCNGVWIPSAVIIVITWMIFPITTMFSKTVANILTVALGVIAVLLQLNMCRLILVGINKLGKGSKNEKRV